MTTQTLKYSSNVNENKYMVIYVFILVSTARTNTFYICRQCVCLLSIYRDFHWFTHV